MLVMFTGPHGTGKSTTALELSRLLPGYTFVESVAGPIAKEIGFDINQPYTPEDLIFYQEKVFTAFEELYKDNTDHKAVFDRSPLDIAAYLSTGLKGKPHYANYVERFEARCIDLCGKYCHTLILPKTDLSETMEDKYNRPVGDLYDRATFERKIELYIERLESSGYNGTVITVPKEYQFKKRLVYILGSM